MKFNLKIIIAVVVIAVVAFWAVDSVRMRSYSGSNLTFDVGSGPVVITNPSDETIPVVLTSTEARSFSVSNATDGTTGASVREGSGRAAIHTFAFTLPAGVTEFTITRGSGVNLSATTDTRLEATVQPMNEGGARTTLIVAVVVILGSLFYISRSTGHRWISMIRRQANADEVAKQAEERASFKRILDRTTTPE